MTTKLFARLLCLSVVIACCSPIITAQSSSANVVLVQMFGRHGSKVPDVIDPDLVDLWPPSIGLPGQFTEQGAFEMRTLGKFIRERYSHSIPQDFDQNKVYFRASSFNSRPLMAAAAIAQGMYPSGPVPIYTIGWQDDSLLRCGNTCPSYNIETARIVQALNQQYPLQFGELIGNITAVTGWGPETLPTNLFAWAGDSVMETYNHGFGDRIHPYLYEMFEVIISLYGNNEWMQFRMQGLDDPRGTCGGEMVRTVIENMEAAVRKESEVAGYFYPGHSTTMNQLWDALNFGGRGSRIGDTLLIELHQIDGEFFVQAHLATPQNRGENYSSVVQQLHCPTPMDLCPLSSFTEVSLERNRVMPVNEGCCFKGQSFVDIGCADYLNPEVLNVPQCVLYRQKCPHNACGVGQVVDAATLLCVPVV